MVVRAKKKKFECACGEKVHTDRPSFVGTLACWPSVKKSTEIILSYPIHFKQVNCELDR